MQHHWNKNVNVDPIGQERPLNCPKIMSHQSRDHWTILNIEPYNSWETEFHIFKLLFFFIVIIARLFEINYSPLFVLYQIWYWTSQHQIITLFKMLWGQQEPCNNKTLDFCQDSALGPACGSVNLSPACSWQTILIMSVYLQRTEAAIFTKSIWRTGSACTLT